MADKPRSASKKTELAADEESRSISDETKRITCGIIMPISSIDSCSEAHWADVREILSDAIEAAGYVPQIVSDADDVGIIQKRIIQNVYENQLVVCDVSGKNPNVMFELGMRLAFDKPTVIVKDDRTSYSFDTAPIEHLQYPRDLRFGQIVEFKKSLAAKLAATHQRATEDPNYTTFLKHFGPFTIAELETKAGTTEEFILDEIRNLHQMIARLGSNTVTGELNHRRDRITLCVRQPNVEALDILTAVASLPGGSDATVESTRSGHIHIHIPDGMVKKEVLAACKSFGDPVIFLPTGVKR